MVSSTFYDLKQIRDDLSTFISDALGYVPLLSEQPTFPIAQDANTIENCRKAVERDADILLLIIGGRYGYIDPDTSISITNIEYITARQKGIPIFTFIQRSVLALQPTWKLNPSADFTGAVDDPRIFAFIENVRATDSAWTFEFEYSREIIETLRIQFAYLFNDGLNFLLKFRDTKLFNVENLTGKSIRLAVEQPSAWEYRLFCQSLIDQLTIHADIRREYELGFALGAFTYIPQKDFLDWILTQIDHFGHLLNVLKKIVNDITPDAFGPHGKPGDPEKITFATRMISEFFREAIEWSLRMQRTRVDDECVDLKNEVAKSIDDMIKEISSIGPNLLSEIENVLNAPDTDEPREMVFTITIKISNEKQLFVELEKYKKRVGI